jgi:hypothetical protein
LFRLLFRGRCNLRCGEEEDTITGYSWPTYCTFDAPDIFERYELCHVFLRSKLRYGEFYQVKKATTAIPKRKVNQQEKN